MALVFDAPQPGTKTCTSCKQTKLVDDFNKRGRSRDGLQAWCRECEKDYRREHHDPIATLDRGRRWRAANPERARDASRRIYRANPAARRQSSRDWRQRNPDKVREQFAAWRAENAEWDRERIRLRREADPEWSRERARQRRDWQRSNGDAEDFTRDEIGERDRWTCGICSVRIDVSLQWPHPLSKSLDHVVPLSRGGSHTRANARIAHLICNISRGNRLDSETNEEGQACTQRARPEGTDEGLRTRADAPSD